MRAQALDRGHDAPYEDLRREFDNWSRPKVMVAAGGGRSHYVLYIHLVDFIAKSIGLLEHNEAEARPISAFLAGRSPNSIPVEAVTGALLDGERLRWKILAGNPELHLETDFLDGLDEWESLKRAWTSSESYPVLGDEGDFSALSLAEGIEQLDVAPPPLIMQWLVQIGQTGATTEPGLAPDSVALLLFKRLLEVDFDSARDFVSTSLEPQSVPALRVGYFQLSLLGAVVAHLTQRKPNAEIESWLISTSGIVSKQTGQFGESLSTSISAMLLAGLFFALENSVNAAHRLDSEIGKTVRRVERRKRKYFFQLLSDTLAQFLSEQNSLHHWYKLLVLCRYLKKESVVWSDIGLVPLLTGTFLRPARQVLFR